MGDHEIPDVRDEARKVADEVIDHLRTMYPAALKAVPGSATTSLRNFTASAVKLAILAAKAEQREADALICENEKLAFLSPRYAANQPIGSLMERFACDECAAAIRKGAA